jgi:DNA (cytosine-5)-methyltransferase 1
VYRLNHPTSILDTRDIRSIKPEDILKATGLSAGELDLFDGSPPCASFSTSGKRQKGWGRRKKYSDTFQRTDDLFFEYARLLRGLQPKTFIAENVSGLIKGKAKGYFLTILDLLKSSGYRVACRLLDAQWLGVPQARQRVIFVGVRNDLNIEPAYPCPLPYRYSILDAIPWIVRVRKHTSKNGKPVILWQPANESPSPTILARDAITSPTAMMSDGGFVEAETDISRIAIGEEWAKLHEGEKSERYLNLIRPRQDQPCPTITAIGGNPSTAGVTHPTERRKFSIAELKRICAFPDDFKLTGTYEQQWERLGRSVPPLMMRAIATAVRDEILAKL